MKLAHIRYTLSTALDEFKNGTAPATHILSAIEALIEEKHAPTATQQTQDIPDLIAGALGVSRGTAYDMMREALAQRTWVGLTDREIDDLYCEHHDEYGCQLSATGYEKAIEAKLREKNT